VAPGSASTDVVYRGTDGTVEYRRVAGSTWSGPVSLGGSIQDSPSIAWAGGRLVVAVRGSDNALWLRWRTGGVWDQKWTRLGGTLVPTSSPAIAGASDGHLYLFVRGSGNHLFTRTLNPGTGWTGWAGLGGELLAPPAAFSTVTGDVHVFATGTNKKVYFRHWDYHHIWQAWTSLNGQAASGPGVTREPNGGWIHVMVAGADGAVWQNKARPPFVFGGWSSLDGAVIGAPAVASTTPADVLVVARGTDSLVHFRHWSNGAWTAWQSAP